jgi:hypothetical protein
MRADHGTVMVYALGGVLLVLAVILVLADTSSLFMRQAALMMVADDAAIAAANAIDVEAIYAQGVGDVLRLDPELAHWFAAASVSATTDARLDDVQLDSVAVVGDAVEVVVSASVPLELGPIAGNRKLRIRARASATTPTRF